MALIGVIMGLCGVEPVAAMAATAASSVVIPFDPVRLAGLVAWVYICLYCVQKIQFSPLVPKHYQTIATLATLVTGPILPVALLVTHAARKSVETGVGFIETLKGYAKDLIQGAGRIRGLFGTRGEGEEEKVKLMDSAGRSLDEIYGHSGKKSKDTSILKLTEQIIAYALDRRASDIHMDPKDQNTYAIRLRVDGVLRTFRELDAETCKAVVNSIKAIANMDIAERRRPQDGAFVAKKGDVSASFRVASAGAVSGEKLSIRALNRSAGLYTVANTGISPKQIEIIREMIRKPSGMILICGSTGSGKTTTLYALLNEMDRFTRNVITVEDPIEAILPETSQIEVNPKADITFAKALRSILRQDPDVICVGEIRDEETAEIALRAAQTGHLVLATMHCDNNAAAVVRLVDLGVSPLLIASGLNLLVSQRLMRCLCEKCKRPAQLSHNQIRDFQKNHIDPGCIFEPVGCEHCDNTGYRGRTAIADVVIFNEELKNGLAKSETLVKGLRTEGAKKGQSSLAKQALKKVVSGITSLAELKRVVG